MLPARCIYQVPSISASELEFLRGINATAAFNQWLGLEVTRADQEGVEITMPWKKDAGQYAGFLHAGVVGALIDTACGFAGAVKAGRVLASHFSVSFLSPAVGERFIARAEVVKAGRRQVFTRASLFAVDADGKEKLVASGETILMTAEVKPQSKSA